MATVAFWLAALLLGYTYVGYPAAVWLWSRLGPRTERRGGRLPTVSIVTVVQNEEQHIERRLRELCALHYPQDLLDIVIASDGSSDDTVRRARAVSCARVRVIDFAEARGKAAALADAVAETRGDVLVFCDARQAIEPDAVRALVAPFGDPQIGAVSGTLVLPEGASSVGRGLGVYWRYETLVRACESRIDSMVGATGALYAIRRELFEPPPPGTLLDDVWIPFRAVRRGYRVLFEPAARAVDEAPRSSRHELARKTRTLAGCFQLFAHERWLLNPFENRLWLQTVSHKGLRLLGPVLLAVLLVASASVPGPFYRAALAAQVAFYALAAIGLVVQRRGPLLAVPYTFCLLQAAALVGFVRFLGDSQPVAWKSRREGHDHVS